MPDPVYGRNLKPGSLSQLSSFTRGWNDQMANFLLPLAFQNQVFKFYDFLEDTITTDFTVGNGGGAGVSNFAASTSKEFGAVTGSTGTANGATSAMSINFDGVFFDAARNPGILVRLKFDAVTALYAEVTWCDAPTQPYVLNWSDIDVPTLASNGTTDVASVAVDTSQTMQGARLLTKGTTDAAAGVDIGTATPGAMPFTAAVYSTVLLQVFQNKAYACIDGKPGLTAVLGTGLDTAIPLRPQVMVQARSATAVVCDIDYIAIWSGRV
jgi:hypothetical protein